jgi:hypothetical protein
VGGLREQGHVDTRNRRGTGGKHFWRTCHGFRRSPC